MTNERESVTRALPSGESSEPVPRIVTGHPSNSLWITANRTGYRRLAEVFGRLAEADPVQYGPLSNAPWLAVVDVNDVLTSGEDDLSLGGLSIDETLRRTHPRAQPAPAGDWQDLRALLGCAALVYLGIAVVGLTVAGIVSLWRLVTR